MEAGRGHPALPGRRDCRRGGAAGAGYLPSLALPALAGGAIAAAVQLSNPFDHGVWLVAYLLLVGSVAPLLLGLGSAAVLEHAPDARRAGAEAALWAAGTILVPLGVLGASRLAVLAGSVGLMLSLSSMVVALRDDAGGERRVLLAAYVGLLLFMACSVCVGLALAWDLPWI